MIIEHRWEKRCNICMEIIYTYLGNGVNRQKTLAFIYSGYNLAVLGERRTDA